MITVEEYQEHVLGRVEPLAPRRVPVTEAHGLRLAEDVIAVLAVPPFDNSAMDGFAVRAADLVGASGTAPVALPVDGDVPAGTTRPVTVGPGRAARIMTGAPLPPGADAVVPVELSDQPPGAAALPARVLLRRAPEAGAHVRRRGEDVRPGDVVLGAGTVLGATHLSAAVSAGHGELLVRPRPRVGVLATGDELCPPGVDPGPGRIPDSNSVLVAGLVREAGGEPVPLGSVGDDPEALRAVVAAALPRLDALVTSGGVSVGTKDVVKAALSGELDFTTVAMQPGKPQGFGLLEGRVPVFALPGNPVSVMVSFHVHVAPALRQLVGRPARVPLGTARAAVGWRCPPGRRQYLPVLVDDGPVASVRPAAAGGSGSHLVASLAAAQALAVVAEDVDAVAPGDEVGLLQWP
ncbi:molybdopterin molybdotransferase [Georgenia satyanarayanai]|uniref:Molybdopterin molybdenumtransferase n=1 Tax=Georgenia satyanarayanai TaxID=860221 RepID=A0A2Y9A4C0_9MICO|nr:gephyrin-like molybdotransferase Glp [Georgenia satyanarayanai]PYG01025.1 molybdopterin molybdotransferase [Georgenia satyanarayanai]SSA39264.1 molybdopterin molybdotransferase [Georgenia satyanarayanai]